MTGSYSGGQGNSGGTQETPTSGTVTVAAAPGATVNGSAGAVQELVDVLKQEGHTVVGCDLGLFDGCAWEPVVKPDRDLTKDVRQIQAADLDGCDAL